jgi:hypothetical protein
VVHVLDDHLSDMQADALSEDDLFPVALGVVRSYATAAARRAEEATVEDLKD